MDCLKKSFKADGVIRGLYPGFLSSVQGIIIYRFVLFLFLIFFLILFLLLLLLVFILFIIFLIILSRAIYFGAYDTAKQFAGEKPNILTRFAFLTTIPLLFLFLFLFLLPSSCSSSSSPGSVSRRWWRRAR